MICSGLRIPGCHDRPPLSLAIECGEAEGPALRRRRHRRPQLYRGETAPAAGRAAARPIQWAAAPTHVREKGSKIEGTRGQWPYRPAATMDVKNDVGS